MRKIYLKRVEKSAEMLRDFLLESESFIPPKVMVGEGNGTPLQYSCLENPMDGGA